MLRLVNLCKNCIRIWQNAHERITNQRRVQRSEDPPLSARRNPGLFDQIKPAFHYLLNAMSFASCSVIQNVGADKVVCSNLAAAGAKAYLLGFDAMRFLSKFFAFPFEDSGSENFQRQLFVAVLLSAVDEHTNTCGLVYCTHSRFNFILVLSTFTVTSLNDDFDFVHNEFSVQFFRQRQDRYRHCGGVPSSLRFRGRNALHDMLAGFIGKRIPAVLTCDSHRP